MAFLIMQHLSWIDRNIFPARDRLRYLSYPDFIFASKQNHVVSSVEYS